MSRLLVVEDEAKLRGNIQRGLEQEQYAVVVAATASEADLALVAGDVDAIILDLMLPDGDGREVLKAWRSRGLQTPVMILTARDTIDDRVKGLDAGADDYLVKPFAFPELLARLRVMLRRGGPQNAPTLSANNLELKLLSRTVTRSGTEISLTTREFELLEYLLRHANQTVTREMIARDVWKETAGVMTNIIDVYVRQLRRKIELPEDAPLIQTIRGQGYMLRRE